MFWNKGLHEQIDKLQKEVVMLRLQKESLMDAYDALDKKHDELMRELSDTRNRLDVAETNMATYRDSLDAYRAAHPEDPEEEKRMKKMAAQFAEILGYAGYERPQNSEV